MYSLLLTYGLNPFTGLKVLVKSTEQTSLWELAQQVLSRSGSQRGWPRLQVSLGRLVPEETKHLSKLEALLRLKFFIALEAQTSEKPLPALPSGQGSAIQLYRHTVRGNGPKASNTEHYTTEVIRFAVGGPRKVRRRRR
ncbi:MAG: hypothetical protein ACUVRV_09270 [Cyanobacteriota bacterium]